MKLFRDFKDRVSENFHTTKFKRFADERKELIAINKYIDSFRSRIDSRFQKIFTIVFVIFALIFVINSMVWHANPGDMLFYPKQILERFVYSADSPGEQVENHYKQFEDRLESYTYLLRKDKCIKAVLAEEELIQKTRQLLITTSNSMNNPKSIKAVSNASLVLNRVGFIESECETNFFFEESSQLMLFAQAHYQSIQNVSSDNILLEMFDDLSTESELFTSNLESFSFKDTDDLNMFNSIVQSINSFKTDIASQDNINLTPELVSEVLYYDILIEGSLNYMNDQEISGIQDEIVNICMLIDNGDKTSCNPSTIESEFNSVKNLSDLEKRFENEILLYNKLLNKLLYKQVILRQN